MMLKEEAIMSMTTADRWYCSNPDCGCEASVESVGEVQRSNPRCACGALLTKKHVSLGFSYLEFLRVDEPLVPPGRSRGE
jgi:hypothetical protein